MRNYVVVLLDDVSTAHLFALTCRWVVECGEVFRAHKSCWAHLIPSAPSQTAVLAEHFFNCACSLMARQLRETVENSLTDLITFLALYKVCVCVW